MKDLTRRSLIIGSTALAASCVVHPSVASSAPRRPPAKPVAPRPVPVACWTRPKWYGFFEHAGIRNWMPPQPSAGLLFVKLDSQFTVAHLEAFSKRGLTPVVSLEPWLHDMLLKDLTNPAYNLDSIIRGDHDANLLRIAKVIKAYGGPVLIRFAHEANGGWYPWGLGIGGSANTGAKYVKAWQKVHAMYPSNARWIWSINRVVPGEPYDIRSMYPGDAWCDYLGWTAYSNRYAGDPREAYSHTHAVCADLTRTKYFVVTETAAPDGPQKLPWINAMGPYLKAHPRIKGFIWFDHNVNRLATDNYGLNTAATRDAFTRAMKTAGF